jgi:hypothetical protein
MVWAAIGLGYKSPLIFIEGSVNSEAYRTMLRNYRIFESIQESAETRGVTLPFFQQDGAPAHTSKTTMAWLEKKTPLIKNWPPNSPDLSPIEMVWAILKKKLTERQPKTLTEFKIVLREEYSDIPHETIDRMIAGMNARFRLCIAHHGECISRLLTRKRLQAGYVIPSDILQPRDISIRSIGTIVKLRAKAIWISDDRTVELPNAAAISLSDIEVPNRKVPQVIRMHVPFREDWLLNTEYFFEAKVMGHMTSGQPGRPSAALSYSLDYIGMITDPFAMPNADDHNEQVIRQEDNGDPYLILADTDGTDDDYNPASADEDSQELLYSQSYDQYSDFE